MATFVVRRARAAFLWTAAAALVAGCGSGASEFSSAPGADGTDAGAATGVPPGGSFGGDGGNIPHSGPDDLKCKPRTCADQGIECGPAGDGCGGVIENCGTCGTNLRCGGPGAPSKCVSPSTAVGCVAKTCDELGIECGPAGDGCGNILSCGSCALGSQCGADGHPSKCVAITPASPDGGACVQKTCADYLALGMDCGVQSNGCGGTLDCGTCTAPAFCGGGGASKCGFVGGSTTCVKKTCADFPGKNCGRQSDGCGGTTAVCGTCTAPEICGGGGVESVCGGGTVTAPGGGTCVKTTCVAQGKDCGIIADGCGGTLDCGSTCAAGKVCGGAGTANVCGTPPCTPITTCPAGMNCGTIANGCGGSVSCGGGCTAPAICGGGGQANVCGGGTVTGPGGTTCTALDCIGAGNKNCGPVADGCGGLIQCGTCTAPDTCGGGGTASVCGGGNSCVGMTCTEMGKNCGPVANGCGELIDCGTCANGAVCGGLGTANVCSGTGPGGGPCTGLCAQQTTCGGGGTTSVSGVVYAPNGTLPIYDAVVYVPNATVDPFPTTGVTCDQCSAQTTALIQTKTNYKGEFTLGNMPVGADIPLVIQIGRWRRQIVIPNVAACTDTPLLAAQTRLPKDKTEGDIPKLAIATGGADALQCLFRKMGIADSEITQPAGTGRIHLYAGAGGTNKFKNGFNGYDNTNRALTSATTLWNSADDMKKYDAMVLTCEGIDDRTADLATYRAKVQEYADAGGRIFASHWHHAWLENGPAPWPTTATFIHDFSFPSTIIADINTTFPKGSALADWLVHTGSTQARGKLRIVGARHSIEAVNSSTSTNWVYVDPPTYSATSSVQYFTVNTPVGVPAANQCGRIVVSDLHVASSDNPRSDFPDGCTTTSLSDQEKALIFMLFDLTACVQSDVPPTCNAKTCTDQGIGCGLAGDGCGGQIDCGDCSNGQTCGGGGVASQCGGPTCTARTCLQQNATCGDVPNGCGATMNCGTCDPGQTCGGGGVANHCGAPSCTASTCEAQNITCGPAGNGCGGTLSCGTCAPGTTCGGGGIAGQCGAPACTPLTQCPPGKNCGEVPDGCGGVVECGTCPAGQECGGGGAANVCGSASCSPKTCATANANCGVAPDGCGSVLTCGDCGATEICSGNQCVVPACTKTTCAAQGVTCGPIGDGCGGLLQCGSCPAGQSCGGGGTPGQCGSKPCAAKSCADLGAVCGQVANGCGALTASCGTCAATQTCMNGACVNACTPRTCAQANATCGHVADGCGGAVDCGACPTGQTCGGGGVANACSVDGPK